ncbi:hypothetical protein HaLaN_04734 [Haematococcus lacustris]|uniref:Uncharacterized protein n=1 Tax=Haematococcus lacustris TaxID=44745 RepID=A0A699YRZ1_HAELA|nr:hypothetical protein HaLaN_04734 [Haematococcus lacustris]
MLRCGHLVLKLVLELGALSQRSPVSQHHHLLAYLHLCLPSSDINSASHPMGGLSKRTKASRANGALGRARIVNMRTATDLQVCQERLQQCEHTLQQSQNEVQALQVSLHRSRAELAAAKQELAACRSKVRSMGAQLAVMRTQQAASP